MHRIRTFLTLTAALVACAGVSAGPALASSDQESIFQDGGNILSNPDGTLATLHSLGVTRIRVLISWNSVAPSATSRHKPRGFKATNPASYPAVNWARYDQALAAAKANGIAVDLDVTGPSPLWAVGPGVPRGGRPGPWRPSVSEFKSFVTAVGTRYSGTYHGLPRVTFWSIWNEPNYGISLAPQATNHDTIEVGAWSYRNIVDAAWSALHTSGHGRDTILIGETAPRGLDHPIGNYSGVKPLRFLRALYCVDSSYRPLGGSAAKARGCPTTSSASARFRSQHPALFQASGFSDHPYAQGFSPSTMTYACGGSKVCGSHTRSDPDYADFAVLPRLERTLDRLNRVYGSRTQFPIWSTEYGYWTNPPEKVATVSPNTAAVYLNWAEYLSWRQRRIRSYAQYLLVDPALGNFASGLEFSGGKPKPTYAAYRMPVFLPTTSSRRGRSLEVWGAVGRRTSRLEPRSPRSSSSPARTARGRPYSRSRFAAAAATSTRMSRSPAADRCGSPGRIRSLARFAVAPSRSRCARSATASGSH